MNFLVPDLSYGRFNLGDRSGRNVLKGEADEMYAAQLIPENL